MSILYFLYLVSLHALVLYFFVLIRPHSKILNSDNKHFTTHLFITAKYLFFKFLDFPGCYALWIGKKLRTFRKTVIYFTSGQCSPKRILLSVTACPRYWRHYDLSTHQYIFTQWTFIGTSETTSKLMPFSFLSFDPYIDIYQSTNFSVLSLSNLPF